MTENAAKRGYVKGTISQVPTPKVFNFIQSAKKTGVLAIARENKKIHIHFLNGDIAYVTSSYFSGLSLGDFLLQEGKISMQIQEESLEKIKETKAKQGTYLIEKGYLSPHDLFEVLNRQVLAKLFWLFEWEEGEFFFKEGEIIDQEFRLIQIELHKLIYLGVRDYMPINRLPTEFRGRKESVLMRKTDLPFRLETLGLGPIDTRILSIINGKYTLRQVVALARLKKRAIYKILYGLFLSGVICFPEGYKFAPPKDPASNVVGKKPSKEGYEISISDDLIAQALSSVDRIRAQVAIQDQSEQAASGQPKTDAAAPPPVSPQSLEAVLSADGVEQTQDITQTLDQLGFKLDEALSSEEASRMEEQFGFDESAPDGFAVEPFDADQEQSGDIFPESDGHSAVDSDFSIEETAYETTEDSSEPEPMSQSQSGIDQFLVDLDDLSDPSEVRKQGMMLLEEGRFNDAARFLERALEMTPQDWELHAYLGWAFYNSTMPDPEKVMHAEDIIKRGMGEGRSSYHHFLFLGKIYIEEDQMEFAELHFIKALELNVDCVEAREQIKRIHSK